MAYDDIRRGAQLNQELQNLIAYQSTPRTANIGSRGPQAPRINVYITPFGTDIGPTEAVVATANQDSIDALATVINAAGTGGQVDLTPPGGDVVSIGRFSPARIKWSRATTRVLVARTSARTGRRYGAYQNLVNLSCPFGRAATDDDQDDAFKQIKIGVQGVNGFEVSTVSLQREKINYRK